MRPLSTTQAADWLGCSGQHVRNLIRAGVLEATVVKLPGSQRGRYAVSAESVKRLKEASVSSSTGDGAAEQLEG